MLVIAERDGTQWADTLGLIDAERVDWNTLREKLRREEQDITILDKIFAYLRNAEESIQREDYERAREQNKQAQPFLDRVNDPIVARQVQEQQEKIRRKLIEQEIRRHLQRAEELRHNQELGRTFDEWEKAQFLLDRVADPSLEQQVQAFWNRPEELDQVAKEIWHESKRLKDDEEWSTAAQGFRKLAHIRDIQEKHESAESWQCLADRYEQLPPYVSQGDGGQVVQLVEFISQYVGILERTKTGEKEEARGFAKDWLEEAYEALEDKVDLYLPWAKTAQQIFTWEDGVDFLDEYREFASKAQSAAEALRKTGRSKDALELLKTVKAKIPEELEKLVEILRNFDGLHWEELGKNLNPAEVERLVGALENGARSLKTEGEGGSD